jgi:hypothetical protein
MSTQEYIRSITEAIPDDFPTLTPLPEVSSPSPSGSFFANITWQTWVIIILILALLGINIFAYLAKGTQETASLFQKIVGPILKVFGFETLETTKQTIETTATGTKAGVDIISGAVTGTINQIEQTAKNGSATATIGNIPQGQQASTTLPVQNKIQETGGNIDQWQQNSLEKALDNAKQSADQVLPDDSKSSIQSIGKAGWCYIGTDHGIRTCAEIGVNDGCMSGDVFPNQSICVNPNLRV